MKINAPRFIVFLIVLVVSIILSVRWELPWYVGFFFVMGTTNFATTFVKAIQKMEENK